MLQDLSSPIWPGPGFLKLNVFIALAGSKTLFSFTLLFEYGDLWPSSKRLNINDILVYRDDFRGLALMQAPEIVSVNETILGACINATP